MTATRSQDDILARFRDAEGKGEDMFGWRREVLASAMTLATLRMALPDETIDAHAPALVEFAARAYLAFAIGKIEGHRGISASRSVVKLREYAWLLGRDDVVSAMDDADYPQYGAPQVKAFADGMAWPWPRHAVDGLNRMARGEHCDPGGCGSGCGQ